MVHDTSTPQMKYTSCPHVNLFIALKSLLPAFTTQLYNLEIVLAIPLTPPTGRVSLPSNPRLRNLPQHPPRLDKPLHLPALPQRLLAPPRTRRNRHLPILLRRLHITTPRPLPLDLFLYLQTNISHPATTNHKRRRSILENDGQE